MSGSLLRPRWLLAHTFVLALTVVFVGLGVWQLNRLEERRLQNEVSAERFAAAPVSLETLVTESGGDLEALGLRRALFTGIYDSDGEVLIRSQVHLGTAGFHSVVPLVGGSGEAVLVNRGWVPLSAVEQTIQEADPPAGEVTVEGWIEASQTRPPLGQVEPPGILSVLNRIDIDRIQEQSAHPLAPVYLVEIVDRGDTLPVPVDEPDFDDDGPHLGYAIQWFGFAAVLVVGYYFLVRRSLYQAASTG